MLRSSCVCTAALLALLGTALSSVAAEPIASTPTTPELGPKTIPQDILRCERNYIYRHKVLPCDSPVTADGEGLRPLLASVPQAREELEIYQANRRSLSLTAYTGMAGLLIAAFAPNFFENRGSKNVTIGIGISITLGSLAFGRSRLMANEVHLDRAVKRFNEANPSDPIELLQPG
ncbi:hypothetical protein EBZ37_10735, partial [bacterium]|nr:hypothetical protein [bacterium]